MNRIGDELDQLDDALVEEELEGQPHGGSLRRRHRYDWRRERQGPLGLRLLPGAEVLDPDLDEESRLELFRSACARYGKAIPAEAYATMLGISRDDLIARIQSDSDYREAYEGGHQMACVTNVDRIIEVRDNAPEANAALRAGVYLAERYYGPDANKPRSKEAQGVLDQTEETAGPTARQLLEAASDDELEFLRRLRDAQQKDTAESSDRVGNVRRLK